MKHSFFEIFFMNVVTKDQGVYTKLTKFKENKEERMLQKLKEELSKQICFHSMLEVFEPSIDRQRKSAEELTKSIRKRPFFQKITNQL